MGFIELAIAILQFFGVAVGTFGHVGSACVNVLAIETELAMTAIETAEARTCRMPCRLASVPTAHFSDATTQAPLTRAETDTRRKLLISTGRLR